MNAATTTAIANHLNVGPNQIKSITELAWVWCVVVHGQRATFVSKKVVMSEKKKVSAQAAAKAFQSKYGGKVWDKKANEVRWYKGQGYLRFAVGTEDKAQVQYFMKSYEITPEIEESVEKFNAGYEIVSIKSPETSADKKCWRDEDGNEVDADANPAEAVYYG